MEIDIKVKTHKKKENDTKESFWKYIVKIAWIVSISISVVLIYCIKNNYSFFTEVQKEKVVINGVYNNSTQ